MASNAAETTQRSFIAIPLDTALKQRMVQLQRELRSAYPDLKPATPDNLHLTLHFLGERSQDELAEIGRIMLSVGEKKANFNVSLEGLGAFPNPRRPRVLWIGLSPPEEIVALYHLLRDRMESAGLHPEQRPFRPHLTLGRFKNPKQKAISLGHFLTYKCGKLQVDKLVLYSSRLAAGGAIHTPLCSVALAKVES